MESSPEHSPGRKEMRLFVHNFLQCHVKGCDANNFPLPITASENEESVQISTLEVEYNQDFLIKYLFRLDWDALLLTIKQLGIETTISLPTDMPEVSADEITEDQDALLREIHRILFALDVVQAKMTCNNCGHIYIIRDGIPNMLLNEAEI